MKQIGVHNIEGMIWTKVVQISCLEKFPTAVELTCIHEQIRWYSINFDN